MLDPEPPELNCPHAWVGDDDCAYCRADSYYAENLSLRAEVATATSKLDAGAAERSQLVSSLDACLGGQEALKAQTVRIRAALTGEPREGVDTEQIAKEVSRRLGGCLEALVEIYQPYFKAKPEYRPSADTIIEQVGTVLSKYNEPAYGSAVESQEIKCCKCGKPTDPISAAAHKDGAGWICRDCFYVPV